MTWKAVEKWCYGLLGGFIGGGATTLGAFMGMALGREVGLEIPKLNWQGWGAIFLFAGLCNAMAYLKKSPLPSNEE